MDRREVSGERGTVAVLAVGLLGLALACTGSRQGAPSSYAQSHAPAGEARAQEAEPPRAIHERIDEPAILVCGGCHTDVYSEWSRSLHHRAWTNENARAATQDFQKESCRPCHSPRSILETGLGRRPAYRDVNQRDGVHCLSCHGREDGVAAARTVPDAPCRPRLDARLVDVDHCYPCHEPTHGAYSEFDESDAAALGLRCADCHMPPVERAAGRMGRSHGAHGGFDAEFVARGVRWDARLSTDGEGAAVEVELTNRTGHKFPGEIPSRALWIAVEPDAGPRADVILRKPNKGEDREDDRLRPDETRVLRFPLAPEARTARVRVLFRPLPLLPPEACHDLGTRELVVPTDVTTPAASDAGR